MDCFVNVFYNWFSCLLLYENVDYFLLVVFDFIVCIGILIDFLWGSGLLKDDGEGKYIVCMVLGMVILFFK